MYIYIYNMHVCVCVFPFTSTPTAPKPGEENLRFCFQDPYLTRSEPVEAILYLYSSPEASAPRIQLWMS